MKILTYITEILKKNFNKALESYFPSIMSAIDKPYSIKAYQQFFEDFDKFTTDLNKESYEALIHSLDEEFMRSDARKKKYDSKGFVKPKPLLTKFGYIKFKRRRYIDKVTGESYLFIDRFLGLAKYSRMDPFVISDLVYESTINSYSKAGKIVSNSIGNKVKYNDDINKDILSRATTRNVVLKASKIMNENENDTYKETEELNIMLDEKFVGSQFNNNKDHMIKSAVVFEGYRKEYKNRIRLTGKKVFGSIENDLLLTVTDYIYYNYDTDKLKKINFMGDGASWIKAFSNDSLFKYHKDLKINFALDHYHFAQAIQRITTNKYKDSHAEILKDYVIHNMKEEFKSVVTSLITLNESREETINTNMEYILGNWESIQNTFHKTKYKCSMESNISHVFADIFTSRPKAYSKEGLKGLLNIRLLKINGYDLKKLYFDSLFTKSKEEKEIILDNKINIKRNINNDKYINYISNSIDIPNHHLKETIEISLYATP